MYNVFRNRIKSLSELTVEKEGNDASDVAIYLGNLLVCDRCRSEEEAIDLLPKILDFYNNDLWNDHVLLSLMIRYTNHIQKYNNEGWMRRGDFTTPETYEAFIKGIETSIRGYILETINEKVTTVISRNLIHNAVMRRMEDLYKPE